METTSCPFQCDACHFKYTGSPSDDHHASCSGMHSARTWTQCGRESVRSGMKEDSTRQLSCPDMLALEKHLSVPFPRRLVWNESRMSVAAPEPYNRGVLFSTRPYYEDWSLLELCPQRVPGSAGHPRRKTVEELFFSEPDEQLLVLHAWLSSENGRRRLDAGSISDDR
jgi:hypothetical protein